MSGECGLIYYTFPVVSTCADIYNECKNFTFGSAAITMLSQFVTTIEGKLMYCRI